MKKYILILSILGFIHNLYPQNTFWNQISGPEGGIVSYFGETEGRTLFIGDGYAGSLWVKENSTNQWTKSEHENLNIHRYLGLDGNRIFVQGSSKVIYSENIYYSDDNGKSWIPSGLNRAARRLWIAPDKTLYTLSNDTLYRSMDRSDTWLPIQINEQTYNYNLSINDSGHLYTNFQDRLEVSKDMGNSWSTIPFYEYSFPSKVLFGPDVLYTLSSSGRDGKLYRSFDNGDTWQGLTIRNQVDIKSLNVHPSGRLFGRTYYGLYISDDNGETWEISFDFEDDSIEQLEFVNENEVFLLMDGKLYYSEDKGVSWTIQNNEDIKLGNIHLTTDGSMYSTPYNQGVWRSTDKGQTWRSFNAGYENVNLQKMVIDHAGNLYGINQYWYGGIYTSNNLGQNWDHIDSLNFFDIQISDQGTLFAIAGNKWNNNQIVFSVDNGESFEQLKWKHGKSPRRFILGSNELITVVAEGSNNWGEWLLQSSDYGVSWDTIQTNITDGDYSVITNFHITPNGNYLVSTYDSYNWGRPCYLSTDEGLTWEQLDIHGQQFTTDSDGGVLVAGELSGFLFRESSLQYSKDDGVSWTTLKSDNIYSGTIPEYYIDFRSNVYSVASDTLSISVSSGESWEILHVGDINNNIKYLATAIDRNFVILTHDNRIYSTKESPVPLNLRQPINPTFPNTFNYPNPFTSYTTIEYVLKEQSDVSLAIYDISGNLIRTLIEDKQPAGTHSLKWDRKDHKDNSVASGLYIFKIHVNDRSRSTIMIAK